jgi:hypothetical protein
MNFNLASRQIWITRHGESLDNVEGRIGGNSDLSPKGDRYAKALAAFIDGKILFAISELLLLVLNLFQTSGKSSTPMKSKSIMLLSCLRVLATSRHQIPTQ